MVDTTYMPKTYRTSGGDKQVIASGGTLSAESGSTVDLSGATLTLPASATLAATAAQFTVKGESATLSTNAATITHYAAQITTESLTTAHTAAATLTITKVGVVDGSYAFISQAGGTNTQGVPVFKAVCTTDTITITLVNQAIATNAFNGTFIFNLLVMAVA